MTAIVVLSMAITPVVLVLYERFGPKKPAADGETREADAIDEHNPILVIGMGRVGQIVNSLLQMAGYHTTVLDLDPTTVDGLNRYGIKTHFGDASRHELLLTAGLESARLLVVAIDNREQALAIVRFARETNPTLRIIARAYDRPHTFELYQAGANEIVRETFDSALRMGKRALENLGVSRERAEAARQIYYRHDRHGLIEQMAELVNAQRAQTEEAVKAALRGEPPAPWVHGDD